MKIEINIDDYLSEEEKKDLCIEYVKEVLRGDKHHKERVLSNMAYNASYKILDESLTEENIKTIKTKVKKIILNDHAYGIFRKKDAWGQEDSEAYKEVKRSIEKHKHLIDDKVKQAIVNRDFDKDVDDNYLFLGEAIINALKIGLK